MVGPTPFYPTADTQKSILLYCAQTRQASFDIYNMRQRFEAIDREYTRENNISMGNSADKQVAQLALKGANAAGDKRKIQDIVIPLAEMQTETAVAYLTSVFLTGVPIFGVVSDANNADSALQMEAVMAENETRGGWKGQILQFFRDGLKYDFSALEVAWHQKKIFSPITDAQFSKTQARPKEIIWQGNCVKRLDPYNTLFDARVPIHEMHEKGEFAGFVELYNRPMLMKYLQSLPYNMNVKEAYESTISGETFNRLYFIPRVFTIDQQIGKVATAMDWNMWALGTNLSAKSDPRIQFKNIYQVATRYIRMVPMDHDLKVPNRNQVQIWKVVTVNDSVVVYLERQTNAHDWLPIIFGAPAKDIAYQSKSFAQKQIPMQDIASSLANSKLAARRKLVADRMFYDPSRIRSEDINSDNPAAKIPVRSTAYGQEIGKAVLPVPFRDDAANSLMQDVKEVSQFSNMISGQNQAQQGQFVKGNKTKSEYEDIQGHSSGRQQMTAIGYESFVFVPVKEILKLNILQYQPPGKVYNPQTNATVDVKPEELRQAAITFKVSDGLVPADKLMNDETLAQVLQVVGTSPQINAEYNGARIFAHLMKNKGIDIEQYRYSDVEKKQMQANRIATIQAQNKAEAKGQADGNPQAGQV